MDCALSGPHFCVVTARIILCSPPAWSRPQSPRRSGCGLPAHAGSPHCPCTRPWAAPPFQCVPSDHGWPGRWVLGLQFYCSVMKESERELGTRTFMSQWIRWWRQRLWCRHDDLWRRLFYGRKHMRVTTVTQGVTYRRGFGLFDWFDWFDLFDLFDLFDFNHNAPPTP